MQWLKIIFCTILVSGLWHQAGNANRLYTWQDKNGVIHISEEPPPENSRLIDIMDYKAVAPPLRDQLPADRQQEGPEGSAAGEDKAAAVTGTNEVPGEEVYSDDDGDRNKRKERKKEKHQDRQEQRESGSEDRQYYIQKRKQQGSAGQNQQPAPSDNREAGGRK